MHNEAVMLKTLFKWAEQRKNICDNPLETMKFKRPIPEPRGGPTLGEVQRLLKTACEPRRTQYAVLAFTGMRSGELQRLRIEDVDSDENWIHIMSREGPETKTGFSRKVPIHPTLKHLLKALPKTRPWPSMGPFDGKRLLQTKRRRISHVYVASSF